MTNEEHLEEMKELDDCNENSYTAEYRAAKALEIIAETLIKIDSKMDNMMTDEGNLKVSSRY